MNPAVAPVPLDSGDSTVANRPLVSVVVPTLDEVDAAGLPESYFTVWSNVFHNADLPADGTFLVHGGAGGIGGHFTLPDAAADNVC